MESARGCLAVRMTLGKGCCGETNVDTMFCPGSSVIGVPNQTLEGDWMGALGAKKQAGGLSGGMIASGQKAPRAVHL